MKFRGLSPRTRALRWSLVAVALGIVVGATAPGAILAIANALALRHDSLPWYAIRALGFLAYYATAASVIYGLLLSTKILDAIAHRPITFTLHQDLAAFGLGLGAVHGVLLTLDRFVPFTLAQVLVPFAAPYQPVWVGVGQVGGYLMALVIGSFYVRRRIGQRTWRALHYLTFLSFVGVTAHGIGTGTDTGTAWAFWSYALASATVAFLLAYRIVVSVSARRARDAQRPASVGTALRQSPRDMPASRPRPAAHPAATPGIARGEPAS